MANEIKYLCWGDPHEDLTKKVEKTVQDSDVSSFNLVGKGPRPWRIIVTCGTGHDNVFEGGDQSHQHEGFQYGIPPDKGDRYWLEQAKNITPKNSIERIDTLGKYLFSTVSIVGTLLTGFGIFSPSGSAVLHSSWLVVPVLFACLSLALAMMGITPRLDNVNLSDVISIRNYYNSLVRKRGRFVFWGGVFFSLSLLSVAIILPTSLNTSDLNPTISLRFMGGGEKAVLTTKVEFQRLPRSGIIETEIFGYSDLNEGAKPTVLFRDISHAVRSGNTTVAAEQDQIQTYKRFVINCRVKSAIKLLYEKTVEISR